MNIPERTQSLLRSVPAGIRVLAATKGRSVEQIDLARQSGIKLIGENYVQEAAHKKPYFKGELELHCIGHLQANKVRNAVRLFDCIETVDSVKLTDLIQKECAAIGKKMPVLIEVNSGNEDVKTGCAIDEVSELALHILSQPNLILKGLMTLGPSLDPRQAFREVRREYEKLRAKRFSVDTLSMGMSNSYTIAIDEGANLIRIGTRIFGKRII